MTTHDVGHGRCPPCYVLKRGVLWATPCAGQCCLNRHRPLHLQGGRTPAHCLSCSRQLACTWTRQAVAAPCLCALTAPGVGACCGGDLTSAMHMGLDASLPALIPYSVHYQHAPWCREPRNLFFCDAARKLAGNSPVPNIVGVRALLVLACFPHLAPGPHVSSSFTCWLSLNTPHGHVVRRWLQWHAWFAWIPDICWASSISHISFAA